MPTVAVTDSTFQTEVLEASLPVLVDFWAEWCGPCKQVGPVLEKLSGELAGRVVIAKVDVDANPMIAQAMRIQSIPTMVLFSGGRPVDVVQGALPEAQLRQFLEPHLAPPAADGISITVADLAAQIELGQPLNVVDIREPVDFKRSHLRRALNVPEAELGDKLAEIAEKSRAPIVLVCRTGEKSKAIAEANEGGPVHIMALEKGLLEWEGDGHPTYSDREEAALDAAKA
ncbi:MAG: thioredoxin [Myxococcota bacterium]